MALLLSRRFSLAVTDPFEFHDENPSPICGTCIAIGSPSGGSQIMRLRLDRPVRLDGSVYVGVSLSPRYVGQSFDRGLNEPAGLAVNMVFMTESQLSSAAWTEFDALPAAGGIGALRSIG